MYRLHYCLSLSGLCVLLWVGVQVSVIVPVASLPSEDAKARAPGPPSSEQTPLHWRRALPSLRENEVGTSRLSRRANRQGGFVLFGSHLPFSSPGGNTSGGSGGKGAGGGDKDGGKDENSKDKDKKKKKKKKKKAKKRGSTSKTPSPSTSGTNTRSGSIHGSDTETEPRRNEGEGPQRTPSVNRQLQFFDRYNPSYRSSGNTPFSEILREPEQARSHDLQQRRQQQQQLLQTPDRLRLPNFVAGHPIPGSSQMMSMYRTHLNSGRYQTPPSFLDTIPQRSHSAGEIGDFTIKTAKDENPLLGKILESTESNSMSENLLSSGRSYPDQILSSGHTHRTSDGKKDNQGQGPGQGQGTCQGQEGTSGGGACGVRRTGSGVRRTDSGIRRTISGSSRNSGDDGGGGGGGEGGGGGSGQPSLPVSKGASNGEPSQKGGNPPK